MSSDDDSPRRTRCSGMPGCTCPQCSFRSRTPSQPNLRPGSGLGPGGRAASSSELRRQVSAGAVGGDDGGVAPLVPGQWASRDCYRVLAPTGADRAELERVWRGDADAVGRMNAKRRQEAERLMRSHTGGQLGGAVGEREARLALATRLEREANPAARRAARKEGERQKREAEARQRASSTAGRDRERAERERRETNLNRQVNEDTRQRWLQWEQAAGSGSTATATAAVGVETAFELVGQWNCGNHQYNIEVDDNTHLYFDGPGPAGSRVRGGLTTSGSPGGYRAFLRTGAGALFAEVGLLCRRDDAGSLVELSCRFKKADRGEWSAEKTATKAPFGAPAFGAAAPADVARPREPMRTGYEDPGVWQCGMCTFINVPNALVCAVCENPQGSEAPWVGVHVEPVAPPPRAAPEAACQSPLPSSKEEPVIPAFEAWLRQHDLVQYKDALLEQGFEDLRDLQEAEQRELDDIFKLIGVSVGHSLRFRRALRAAGDVGGGAAAVPQAACCPSAPSAAGSTFECPICCDEPPDGQLVLVTPCGHAFCATHARDSELKGACPQCRQKVTGTQRVYV